jgi:N-acetyl-anhydromuramyl-L-alanine amidase AmpD
MSLLWLPQALFDAGLKVSEVPGWKTRGHGELNIRMVLCHHTASLPGKNAPSLNTVINGRPDLPGPLCQVLLGRDGTCYVVSNGRANHAGRGVWTYRASNGKTVTVTNGNGEGFGIEAEHQGDQPPRPPEKWTEKQLESYAQLVAVVLRHEKLPAGACAGHKEYATPKGRKSDPNSGFSMPRFRDRVGLILGGNAPAPQPIDPGTKERPTLRRAAKGAAVEELQKALGILPVDGAFGPKTEAAVRKFQREHDLVADGIVGPRTWAEIDAK